MSELPLPSNSDPTETHTRTLDVILDHPKLWGIVALVAFAATFSPKVSVNAMWALLVAAWVLGQCWIAGLFRGKRHALLSGIACGLVLMAALFSCGRWLAIPLKEQPTGSRLEVVKVQGLPMQKKGTNQLGFFINVFYADKGDVPTTAMNHRAVYLPSSHLLSENELLDLRKTAASIENPPRNDGEEIQPGLTPEHLFTVPQDDNEALQLKQWADDVMAGKIRLYLFVTMKYVDSSLPQNQIRVTEFCGWFMGTFDMWHNCGNKVYTQNISK